MTTPSEQMRRADRRFWRGVAAFFAVLAVILGLGLVCAKDEPADPPGRPPATAMTGTADDRRCEVNCLPGPARAVPAIHARLICGDAMPSGAGRMV